MPVIQDPQYFELTVNVNGVAKRMNMDTLEPYYIKEAKLMSSLKEEIIKKHEAAGAFGRPIDLIVTAKTDADFVKDAKFGNHDYAVQYDELNLGSVDLCGTRPKQEDQVVYGKLADFDKLTEKQRKAVLVSTFAAAQALHGRPRLDEMDQVKDVGSTAIMSITQGNKLYTASVGDSTVHLLIKKADGSLECRRLNKLLHSPNDDIERLKNGGFAKFVDADSNRLGGIGVSRAIGDTNDEEIGLSHDPDIYVDEINLKPGEEAYLIAACDGLTERATKATKTNDADYVKTLFKQVSATAKTEAQLAIGLAKAALEDGTTDNVSVVVKKLDTTKKAAEVTAVFDGHGGQEVSHALANKENGMLALLEKLVVQTLKIKPKKEKSAVTQVSKAAAVVADKPQKRTLVSSLQEISKAIAEQRKKIPAAKNTVLARLAKKLPTIRRTEKFHVLKEEDLQNISKFKSHFDNLARIENFYNKNHELADFPEDKRQVSRELFTAKREALRFCENSIAVLQNELTQLQRETKQPAKKDSDAALFAAMDIEVFKDKLKRVNAVFTPANLNMLGLNGEQLAGKMQQLNEAVKGKNVSKDENLVSTEGKRLGEQVVNLLNEMKRKDLEAYLKNENVNLTEGNLPATVSQFRECVRLLYTDIDKYVSADAVAAANAIIGRLPEELHFYKDDLQEKMLLIYDIYAKHNLDQGSRDFHSLSELSMAIPTKKTEIAEATVLQEIKNDCYKYARHILDVINQEHSKIPAKYHVHESKVNVDEMLQDLAENNLKLDSSDTLLAVKKYQIVQGFLQGLNDNSKSPGDRLNELSKKLSNPETKAILDTRRKDKNAGLEFVKTTASKLLDIPFKGKVSGVLMRPESEALAEKVGSHLNKLRI